MSVCVCVCVLSGERTKCHKSVTMCRKVPQTLTQRASGCWGKGWCCLNGLCRVRCGAASGTWLFTTLCLLGCAFYDFHVPHSTVSSQSTQSRQSSGPMHAVRFLLQLHIQIPELALLHCWLNQFTSAQFERLPRHTKTLWHCHCHWLAFWFQALCYLKHSCATYQADTNMLTLLHVYMYVYVHIYICVHIWIFYNGLFASFYGSILHTHTHTCT